MNVAHLPKNLRAKVSAKGVSIYETPVAEGTIVEVDKITLRNLVRDGKLAALDEEKPKKGKAEKTSEE